MLPTWGPKRATGSETIRRRPSLEFTKEHLPGRCIQSGGDPGQDVCPSRMFPLSLELLCPQRAVAPSHPDTHVNAQPERGHGRSLAQGQQQQEQGCGQLHQVEEVVVSKEVGRQRFGILGVGEELVVILTFLKEQASRGRTRLETIGRPGCVVGGEGGGPLAGGRRFRPESGDDGEAKV